MKKRLFVITISMLFGAIGIYADNLSNAKTLYTQGDYEKALPLFEKEYKAKPKDGVINHYYGVCLFETGHIEESRKYLEYANSRNVIESPHYLAKLCWLDYNFEGALDMYEKYREIMERNKRFISDDTEEEISKVKQAKSMLDHVEKIAVIDSITVDKEAFFKHYHISDESGTLGAVEDASYPTVSYTEQSGDRKIWSKPDETGKMRLCESARLIDGSWDETQYLSENLNDGGDANYPFLMQDGTTLYYASNGDSSIGGYDIYFTVKDTETGEYMLPQNVGMPYNSPADDYLLVLDEMTGLGWWATDRNNIPGKVTIYVFVRNEIRENYEPSEEQIASYAKLSNYHLTWHGNDYSQLVRKIRLMETNALDDNVEFVFCVKKGVIYTSFADFQSDEASEQMRNLLELYENLSANRETLKQKRELYSKSGASGRATIKDEILKIEKDVELLRADIFKAENNVRRLEQNN